VHFLPRREIKASENGIETFAGFLLQRGEEAFRARFDILRGPLRPLLKIRSEPLRLSEKTIQGPLLIARDQLAGLLARAAEQGFRIALQLLEITLQAG